MPLHSRLRSVSHAELEDDEDRGFAPDSFEAFLAEAEARERYRVLLEHRQRIIGTGGKPEYYRPRHDGDKRSGKLVEHKADEVIS